MPVRAMCKPRSPDIKKRRSNDWRKRLQPLAFLVRALASRTGIQGSKPARSKNEPLKFILHSNTYVNRLFFLTLAYPTLHTKYNLSQENSTSHYKVMSTIITWFMKLTPTIQKCAWPWHRLFIMRCRLRDMTSDAQTPWHMPNLWYLTHTCQTCDINLWHLTHHMPNLWHKPVTSEAPHAKPVT